ncbi:MAG TPA: DUF3488 and transglutaminase-like domain-containing protein, partial [Sandaracinaceae bacterium]
MGATFSLTARMLVQALPVMLALFVLFPRLSGPLWALPNDPRRAVTGLSDSMTPGDITELAQSDEVAFRVEFSDVVPPPEALYWRGPVLTVFDGRRWTRSWASPMRSLDGIEYLGEPVEYHVTLEPNGQGWIFALDLPREWSGIDRMRMADDYQLVVPPGRTASRRQYRVVSHTSYRTIDSLSDLQRARLTRLPEGSNPRTLALVQGWRARGLDAERIIAEALRMFREQPFRYTLTPPPLGADSVDDFLFETRAGFCGHYASAFAVMMRAAGVPARVVTGYQGGELNTLGGHYTVRQSDAHAWVEVWLEGRGWTRVDPTAAVAPERIELGSAASADGRIASGRLGLGRTLRLAWDALDAYWYGWVIGYGEARQRMLLERVGLDVATPALLSAVTLGAVAAIIALIAAYHGLAQRGRKRKDPAARAFAAFCRRLARCGIAPPRIGETPTAFAARAEHIRPDLGTAIRQIAAAYVRARYEPDVEGLALARLERLVKSFRPARRGARASRGIRSR